MNGIDSSLREHLTTSGYGFRLEDRHFYAIYKTRLIKYDGNEIGEEGRGNIISFTGLFPAMSKKDARKKAPDYFHLNNQTFYPLKRQKMVVEHVLLDVKEVVVPDFRNVDFKVIHKFTQKLLPNRGEPLPPSFLGFHTCIVERIMPHLNSEEASSYLYHPWHGAGDNYAEWYECKRGTANFYILQKEFNNQYTREVQRFQRTEYTNLDKAEQELMRTKARLDDIGRSHAELLNRSTQRQGRFFIEYGRVVFIPEEFNCLRNYYLSKKDKEYEIKHKIEELEDERRFLARELESLKKEIA